MICGLGDSRNLAHIVSCISAKNKMHLYFRFLLYLYYFKVEILITQNVRPTEFYFPHQIFINDDCTESFYCLDDPDDNADGCLIECTDNQGLFF